MGPCEDTPSKCNNYDNDVADCKNCAGKDGKCTTGSRSGCRCIDIFSFYADSMPNGQDFFTQQISAWEEWIGLANSQPEHDSPSKNPTCAGVNLDTATSAEDSDDE